LRRLWWIVGVLVVAAVLTLALRKREPPLLPFARIKRQTVVSTLPTNGKLEPIEWESVRAETSGLIVSVPVREGDLVAAGAVIARISQPGVQEELNSAEARAAQSRSALDILNKGGSSSLVAELDAGIAKARFDRDVAQRDVDALTRMEARQAATHFEVLTAKQRLDAAELAIKTLTERRNALVSPNDVAAGRARLSEAQADANSAREKLNTGIVRSPMAGTVYSLPARPGFYVNAGDLIANVGRLDHLRVKVYVDEPELGRISVGLPVRITWDGLPGREWDGVVEKMPSEIVPLASRQVGEVWVTIDNARHDLVPGITVNAEIKTDLVRNALVVPKTAIRHDRIPQGVFVLRSNRLAWQPIETGASDVTYSSVRQGLKEGELVLLPTDNPVKEGDKARVEKPIE
jgi:HlyD family secretion protein